ncbi:MAG: hypothetical protein IPO48_06790 [Saprospiraceae bacterium]|nr:hypothetical protein [Saprospiraceae bacterium]
MNKYLIIFLLFFSIGCFGIGQFQKIFSLLQSATVEEELTPAADIELINPNLKCVNGSYIFEFAINNKLKFNLDSVILEVNSPSRISIASNLIIFNPYLGPSEFLNYFSALNRQS